MRPRRGALPLLLAAVAFVLAYTFLFPTGCDASDAPSWERCVTVMGNPAFSLSDWGLDNTVDIVIPLAVGVLAWLVVSRVMTAQSGRRSAESH